MKHQIVYIKYLVLPLIVLLSWSCKSTQPQNLQAESDAQDDNNISYVNDIKTWQQKRVASLKKANGWTTLTGLIWLKEGKQSFGSDPDQDILFPDNMPGEMGYYFLNDGKLSCTLNPDLDISINEEKLSTADLIFDADGTPSLFNWKSHFWYPIKRGEKYGLRLRDTLHPARFSMTTIPCYPIDKNWKIKARVLDVEEGQSVNIDNIVGISSENPVAAILEFEKNGQTHQILALNGGTKSFFLIIADETSGEDTYGGGRYLIVDRPEAGNETFIDFNKTYNPPCAFTNYATCPLPPKENYLKLAITAGEKMVNIDNH